MKPKKVKKPERVIIDCISTEDGYEIYQICKEGKTFGIGNQADICSDTGIYQQEEYLDSDLEEYGDKIKIVADCRIAEES